MFEIQAAETPDAVAVTFADSWLTYGQLNARANQLARHLLSLGVGPDVLVALCVDRSLEMIMGMLGILKAGGAYLPLDFAHPRQRLAFLLEDAGANVLLTQEKLLCNLPPWGRGSGASDAKRVAICLDSDWSEITANSSDNPRSDVHGEHPAYLIYTSGSSGKPKGVLVSHRNVVRLFTSTRQWFDFGPSDIWTLFHSFTFDFSVWEIWGALLHGGRLVVVPYLVSRSPASFYRLLAGENVTVLNQTPSAFRQLIWAEEYAETRHRLNLRYVILGGEALEFQSLKPWIDRHGDQQPRLINMYGITETTVHVTYRPITAQDLIAGRGSVIGVPIPDLQLYLLDENMKPVSPGAEGELFVGGAGLALGYLNRADLTAQRFVANPFTGTLEDRLYRTGDLARRHPNGELEYLGRCDDQVKIRGFRIELGEIQSALNRHPQVRDSVVIARACGDGGRQLAAYVVAQPEEQPSWSDLRSFLKEQLPEYMIPAVFLFLEALPLTANGKVDQRALPGLDHVRPALKDEYAAPKTPRERLLAEIWSEVLEVQPVGVDDSFFELGGDSIRAIKLLALAQAQGLNITLQELFGEQTIRRILQRLERAAAPPGSRAGRIDPFSMVKPEDRLLLPAGLEDAYPLLALQGALFYHNDRFPESAAYHDVFTFRVQFSCDEEKLKTAIEQFVTRHAPMRTSFDLGRYSRPLQLVHESVTIPFLAWDSRRLSPGEQEKELIDYINLEKHRPFDRTQAPMVRFGMQRVDDSEFRFIVGFHHAVLDGWSLATMVTEILTDYGALIQGSRALAPAPKVYYREYVALELKALAAEDCRRYWADKLRDPDIRRLPRWPESDRTGGTEQVRSSEVVVPDDVLEGLKGVARTAGVPLRSVLQAAHHHVMSWLHGTPDVISGLVTNGRPEEIDGERMIGLLLNVVPLRIRMSGGTWLELVRQVFAAERELIPFRRYPVTEIVRITGGQWLFESAFDFVHFHVYRNLAGCPGMGFRQDHYFEANSFTLFTTFMMDVSYMRLRFHLDYDPAEMCPPQIKQILGYYVKTLAAMAHDPSARYENLSPMSPEECRQMLVEWNSTRREYPRTKCLHELIEAQVERTPEAIAVIFGTQVLTYAELNQRANRLAHLLAAVGVDPDTPVGLYVERSADMLVAMLAIHKAGGAYVPLDPAYPAERLAFMLEDSRTPVLVTQGRLLPGLPQCSAKIICLDAPDTIADLRQRSQADRPPSRVGPDSLAYIIYTSGSTGHPKGVAIEHHSPVALVHWAQEFFSAEELDGVLASTSICFDLSIFEIFVTLGCGGKVILAENALQLSDLPGARQVTLINTVPSVMKELVRSNAIPSSVRAVNVAGEPLPTSLVRQIYQLPGIKKVYDLYGPSEATTYSTCTLRLPDGPASIGRPIANTQVYLLDTDRRPVPVGVTGELYIAGDGLARGYLNRPKLTAEKFLPNPFSDQPGARFYRTGDLARYLPDGNIEFLGRIDDQVKIRGYRIELGEIEAVLRRHPNVKDAAVIVRQDTPDDPRLAAYCVAREQPAPGVAELSDFSRRLLPDYMIPGLFVTLPALPLMPNGKVDRKALMETALPQRGPGRSPLAPRNSEEETLAAIWARLLERDQVSVNENFFELGGHSLLAVAMFAQIKAAFGKQLPLATLFHAPTIEHLAAALCDEKWQAGSVLVPIQPNGSRPPLFCVHPADGEVMLYRDLAFHLGNDQPVFGLQSAGIDGSIQPLATVEEMAARYVREMKTLQRHGPWCLAGYCLGAFVALEIARRLQEQGETVGLLAVINTSGQWRMVGSAGKAVAYHWQNLSLLGPGGKARYLSARAKYRMTRIQNKVTISICRFWLAARRALPPNLLRLYLTELNHSAGEAYHPGTYRGRLVYLHGSLDVHQNPRLFWTGTASEGVDVITVPGGNIDVLKEPNVRGLAKHLRACLDQACYEKR
jgi:amino acid adenylation domain-containing protein